MKKREQCPICDGVEVEQLDRLDGVPVLLNSLAPTTREARNAPRGTLDVVGCAACGFVWNRSFEPEIVVYSPNYENDQTHSPSFRGHMNRMASKVLAHMTADGATEIVEVGCGQGVFLKALLAAAGSQSIRASGFDPAFRDNALGDDRIRVFRKYFDDQSVALLERPPTLVITRHTIEHVADPVAFLSTIRRGIGRSPARLLVETPDVRWTLSRAAIEDLFYEHCSLFSPQSLALAMSKAGFQTEGIELVFDEQYLWAQATANRTKDVEPPAPLQRLPFPDLGKARQAFVSHWKRCLADSSRVVVWGAGAKGVTFCTQVDAEGTRIAAVVDINPAKQDKFIPVSGHRVIAPESLAQLRPDLVVVMNPNYREEIGASLTRLGLGTRVLSLGPADGSHLPASRSSAEE